MFWGFFYKVVWLVFKVTIGKGTIKQSRIRETLNLSTNADSITIAMKRKKTWFGDVFILKKLLSLAIFFGVVQHFCCVLGSKYIYIYICGRSCHDGYLNKKLGIFALLYFHIVNYTTILLFFIDFILTYRSRGVIICKNMNKNKSAHPLSNKIQTFLKFLMIILKISFLQS